MKRSEIIRVISQYLIIDRFYTEKAEADAEELLTLLEKFGMLPPPAKLQKLDTIENRVWEPEDET